MPQYVVKVSPDRDFYVEWSTIVDDVIGFGTRVEMIDHLRRNSQIGGPPEPRMERADLTGTSINGARLGGWDHDTFVINQLGLLSRSDLEAYAVAKTDREAFALLKPFEDDKPGKLEKRIRRALKHLEAAEGGEEP